MGKDSSDLLWDDINRPKFYTLLTCASATIRTCLYPAALIKTRLQASTTASNTPSTATTTHSASHASPHTVGAMPHAGAHHRHGLFHHLLHPPVYEGTSHAFRTILRMEGKFAFYRGFRINLLGLACDPIVIGCIEWSRTQLTYYSKTFTPYAAGHYASPFFHYVMSPETAITLVSAGGAACVGQIIQVPVDVISQKKQMQMHPLQTATGSSTSYPGTSSFAIARQIIQTEGLFKGLYKGFGITLCSATPFSAILWAVYWPTQRFLHNGLTHPVTPTTSESTPPFSASLPPSSVGLPTEKELHPSGHFQFSRMPEGVELPDAEKQYWHEEQMHELERQQHGSTHHKFEPEPNGWFNWRESLPTPVAAFVASASASLATQPIDVIKTRLQVGGGSNSTIMSTIRTLIKECGYRGLTIGWYPRILAVSPGTTIMMSSYELLKRYCQK